jgi:hypothetical protein
MTGLLQISISVLLAFLSIYHRSTPLIHYKTFKFKIGVLWATIAQKQQISGDFI